MPDLMRSIWTIVATATSIKKHSDTAMQVKIPMFLVSMLVSLLSFNVQHCFRPIWAFPLLVLPRLNPWLTQSILHLVQASFRSCVFSLGPSFLLLAQLWLLFLAEDLFLMWSLFDWGLQVVLLCFEFLLFLVVAHLSKLPQLLLNLSVLSNCSLGLVAAFFSFTLFDFRCFVLVLWNSCRWKATKVNLPITARYWAKPTPILQIHMMQNRHSDTGQYVFMYFHFGLTWLTWLM